MNSSKSAIHHQELYQEVLLKWKVLQEQNAEIDKDSFDNGINWLYSELYLLPKPKIVYCDSWIDALLQIYALRSKIGKSAKDSEWANPIKDLIEMASLKIDAYDYGKYSCDLLDLRRIADDFNDRHLNDAFIKFLKRNNNITTSQKIINSLPKKNKSFYGDDFLNFTVSKLIKYHQSFQFSKDMFSDKLLFITLDFYEQIGVLEDENVSKYIKMTKAGAFRLAEFENYVFAVQPPTKLLYRDGFLNAIDGKAIEFRDGTGFYFINNTEISTGLFKQLREKKLTPEMFLKIRNEEKKAAILDYLRQTEGEEGVYHFFKKFLTEADTYVHKRNHAYLEGTTNSTNIGVYTLFSGAVDNFHIAYVRCYCPSTDRMFFLGVESSFINAKDAIASLYQIPEILANNILSISRQGEKFSTVFDVFTTKKLENNEFTDHELNQRISISGNRYFELITYEY